MAETSKGGARPRRRMLLGISVGLILVVLLVLIFLRHVGHPSIAEKPSQAPLPTQQ